MRTAEYHQPLSATPPNRSRVERVSMQLLVPMEEITQIPDTRVSVLIVVLSDSTWVYCGTDSDGNRDCEHPTDEKFGAADKSALVTLWTAGVSTPTSTIVSSTALGTSSASGMPTQTAEPVSSLDGGLSTGAKAGIGVGVGVGAVAVVVIAVFFVLRRRKHAPMANVECENHQSAPLNGLPQELPPSELPGGNKASRSRIELQ
ncbi:hypothetical protein N7522_012674 [Penicillium canescens]|nr:hypothetical protein N7522_012674 [Penicillium canescens]